MQKTFTFYSDPGHGWVKVHREVLRDLGIDRQITHYSYMSQQYAYLEEDLDASTFQTAYAQKYGFAPRYVEQNNATRYSRIRNYPSYNAEVLYG